MDGARLLANLIRWAGGRPPLVEVDGPGLLDVQLYEEDGLVLHVVNLTNEAAWRPPATEIIKVSGSRVRIRTPQPGRRPRALVGERDLPVTDGQDGRVVDLGTVVDHEVVVLE